MSLNGSAETVALINGISLPPSATTPHSTWPAVEILRTHIPNLEPVFIESGDDNLSATLSQELTNLIIYILDADEGKICPEWVAGHRLDDIIAMTDYLGMMDFVQDA